MSVSIVDICNSALVKVGAARISSITQDTKSAILLNSIFSLVRDSVLRAHPWKFAIKRAVLAPTSTVPEFGYDLQYDIPSDCLRILDTDLDDVDYVVETDNATGNKVILSDETEIQLRYIFRQTDPTMWDSNFAEALAWRLARDIAYALTQSATMVASCDDQFKVALAEARSMSAVESPLKSIEADAWTWARR